MWGTEDRSAQSAPGMEELKERLESQIEAREEVQKCAASRVALFLLPYSCTQR